jgi:arylsulfatase A-like enzyme
MVHDGRHKLIYYPTGHRFQLFDLRNDPNEMHDLSEDPEYADIRERLTGILGRRLYGSDMEWVRDGELVGLPEPELTAGYGYNPNMGNARGYRVR